MADQGNDLHLAQDEVNQAKLRVTACTESLEELRVAELEAEKQFEELRSKRIRREREYRSYCASPAYNVRSEEVWLMRSEVASQRDETLEEQMIKLQKLEVARKSKRIAERKLEDARSSLEGATRKYDEVCVMELERTIGQKPEVVIEVDRQMSTSESNDSEKIEEKALVTQGEHARKKQVNEEEVSEGEAIDEPEVTGAANISSKDVAAFGVRGAQKTREDRNGPGRKIKANAKVHCVGGPVIKQKVRGMACKRKSPRDRGSMGKHAVHAIYYIYRKQKRVDVRNLSNSMRLNWKKRRKVAAVQFSEHTRGEVPVKCSRVGKPGYRKRPVGRNLQMMRLNWKKRRKVLYTESSLDLSEGRQESQDGRMWDW